MCQGPRGKQLSVLAVFDAGESLPPLGSPRFGRQALFLSNFTQPPAFYVLTPLSIKSMPSFRTRATPFCTFPSKWVQIIKNMRYSSVCHAPRRLLPPQLSPDAPSGKQKHITSQVYSHTYLCVSHLVCDTALWVETYSSSNARVMSNLAAGTIVVKRSLSDEINGVSLRSGIVGMQGQGSMTTACVVVTTPPPPPLRPVPSLFFQTGEAMSLLQEMRAAQGVPTNMASYRAIISAYCRAGDWAPATGLLEDARKEQLKPDTGDLRMLVQVHGY